MNLYCTLWVQAKQEYWKSYNHLLAHHYIMICESAGLAGVSSEVGLDDGLLVCTLLLLRLKVSGSIPPGSSPVLLFLLAVGCELLASFCCCGCCCCGCCCCCCCFWWCFSPCCWQWNFLSGARAIGAIEWCCCCRCCCWWCFWPCCLQSQAQERLAALAGGW